jgi:hypothetical protein
VGGGEQHREHVVAVCLLVAALVDQLEDQLVDLLAQRVRSRPSA